MASDQSEPDSSTLFEALIIPHRSLSPRGVRLLTGAFAVCGVLIAARFWLLGAWPVIGFAVVEIALAAILLQLNVRRACSSELVLLNEDALRIVRTDPAGCRTERALPTAWLNVRLLEEAGKTPRLVLGSHLGQEEVGASLGETEKRDLAQALREVLHRSRHPSFDNPQLRC